MNPLARSHAFFFRAMGRDTKEPKKHVHIGKRRYAYSESNDTRINDANQADSIEGCGRDETEKHARSTGRSCGDRYLPVAARPGISRRTTARGSVVSRRSRYHDRLAYLYLTWSIGNPTKSASQEKVRKPS